MAEDAASLAVEDSKIPTTARGQCYICQRVASALIPKSGDDIPKKIFHREDQFVLLSSWAELRSNRSCTTCSRITDSFEIQLEVDDPHSATYQFCIYYRTVKDLILALSPSPLPFSEFPSLRISLSLVDESSPHCAGVIMNPCWLDLERVTQWIKTCDTTHTECYRTASVLPTKSSFQNMFFISVSKGCLVKANPGERYIALSYVWGPQLSQFRATRAEVSFLRSEGSLSSPRIWERLGGTIQRAMQFVSSLEVDLLWVDRLCIVQDDPVHTASQINSMASIYSNAYFTLCAADGTDSESGLQGVPHTSRPRNLQQDIFAFHGDERTFKFVTEVPNVHAVYDERAWTLQESVLSRRILAFRNNGLQWKCSEMSCHEQDQRSHQSQSSDMMIRDPRSQWPSVYRWAACVFDYQNRKLTYEHDVLRAFSGIMEAMSEYMPGGFHFGLPELFFDIALLWVPRFRMIRREGGASGNVGCTFPSWSWAGWTGILFSHIHVFEENYKLCESGVEWGTERKPQVGDLIPSVKWFKIRMDTSELIKVCNDYDRYRDSGLRGDVELQPGWSSHTDENSGLRYYKYDRAEIDFRYPLPTIRHPQPADTHSYQSVLFCRAWRVYLELGSALSHVEQKCEINLQAPIHWMATGDRKWAGVLYVHRAEDSTRLDEQCELVMISSNSVFETAIEFIRPRFPELYHLQRPRSGDRYHFYYLLWIEWQNGIAYRKGLARVAKSVYDDLPKEEIDLYLG